MSGGTHIPSRQGGARDEGEEPCASRRDDDHDLRRHDPQHQHDIRVRTGSSGPAGARYLRIVTPAPGNTGEDLASPRGIRVHPVWLKYCVASSGLAVIVAEQSTKAFSPQHVTRLTTTFSLRRDASVVETLMIALGMIVGEVLVDHMI